VVVRPFKKSSDSKALETTGGDLLKWEVSNYVANSAVTHLKSIGGDIVELFSSFIAFFTIPFEI
jgi:hypothetical protein